MTRVEHEADEIDVEHSSQLHCYSRRVAFQFWENGATLRLHSLNAPDTHLSPTLGASATRRSTAPLARVRQLIPSAAIWCRSANGATRATRSSPRSQKNLLAAPRRRARSAR
jgi:hypothetical protein